MEIRRATINDLEILSEIEASCFPPSEGASRESLRSRLEVYPEHFYLLLDDGRPVGFVNGLCTDEKDLRDEMYENSDLHNEDGDYQMIFGLDTIPSYRSKGCASMLMNHLIAEARKEKRKAVVLTCKEALIPFYEKFGFKSEGISTSTHGDVTWYQMRLTL